jgi:4-amino-4-deoxy-L-arabinose transferase-like glycosyltransferase
MKQNVPTSDTFGVAEPEKSSPITNALLGLGVAVAAFLVIFWNLADEPYFIDESAMIGQSYYYTLLKTGQWQHPDWLHYAAFDHPPLPKYFFGLSLDLVGLPVPTTLDRWMKWAGFERVPGGWQKSMSGGDFSPPGDPRVLFWARMPSALFGAAGAAALFAVGLQLHSRLAGLIAAVLITFNPLYLTHARRAMSDSFTECLVVASFAVGLWGCRLVWSGESRWWKWTVFAVTEAVLCGLAALAKLNGGIASLIVLAMLGGTWLLRLTSRTWRCSASNKGRSQVSIMAGLATAAIACGSFAVFVVLNPFLTAHPISDESISAHARELAEMGLLARAKFLINFRREWSEDSRHNPNFRKDWLPTFSDRARMTAWEGFGRFSSLGPRDIRTHEPRPDRERFSDYGRAASLIWLPLVVWGLVLSAYTGWQAIRSNRPPLVWALILYTILSLAIVVLLIPLNWDRYYLPLQAPASALVAIAVIATVQRTMKRFW